MPSYIPSIIPSAIANYLIDTTGIDNWFDMGNNLAPPLAGGLAYAGWVYTLGLQYDRPFMPGRVEVTHTVAVTLKVAGNNLESVQIETVDMAMQIAFQLRKLKFTEGIAAANLGGTYEGLALPDNYVLNLSLDRPQQIVVQGNQGDGNYANQGGIGQSITQVVVKTLINE